MTPRRVSAILDWRPVFLLAVLLLMSAAALAIGSLHNGKPGPPGITRIVRVPRSPSSTASPQRHVTHPSSRPTAVVAPRATPTRQPSLSPPPRSMPTSHPTSTPCSAVVCLPHLPPVPLVKTKGPA